MWFKRKVTVVEEESHFEEQASVVSRLDAVEEHISEIRADLDAVKGKLQEENEC